MGIYFIILLITILLFRLCYFFEDFSKFESKSLVGIFIFLFLIIAFFFTIAIQIYDVKKIKDNYALSEGKVTFYHTGRGKSDGEVRYDFKVNEEWISNAYFENHYIEIPDEKPDTTISYLVIYEKSSPQNGFLLFNYPITDKDDLLEYEELFKKGIPDDVFYN
jgi:hypothetical protein